LIVRTRARRAAPLQEKDGRVPLEAQGKPFEDQGKKRPLQEEFEIAAGRWEKPQA